MNKERLLITFTGDILSTYRQNKRAYIGNNRYSYLGYFCKLKERFSEADYVIGSLETPIAGAHLGYTKEDTNFNTPDDFLVALKDVGFNMVSTATNHCLDRGVVGLRRTINKLDQIGIEHTGTFLSDTEPKYLLKKFGDLKIAFVAYTYGTNSASNGCILNDNEDYLVNLTRKQDRHYVRRGIKKLLYSLFSLLPISIKRVIHRNKVSITNECVSSCEIDNDYNKKFIDGIKNCISEAKQNSDLVFFCLHSGGQFNSTVGEYTSYLVNVISSLGVDVIICNHTHTVLQLTKKENCFIAYSLGNFAFPPKEDPFIDGVYSDYSILLDFELDSRDKKILNIYFSVIKNIKSSEKLSQVVLAYDLYMNEDRIEEKKKLENDIIQVVSRFTKWPTREIKVSKRYQFL